MGHAEPLDDDLRGLLLAPEPPPFALLRRAGFAGQSRVEVLTGQMRRVTSLSEIPLRDAGGAGHEAVVLLPYRQLRERGFACRDDREPILVMRVTRQYEVDLDTALRRLPDEPVPLREGAFDLDDRAYAELVRTVMANEIGAGAGSNFVIHRSYRTQIDGSPARAALALFRRLLLMEPAAYWTFAVHCGERTFVGASPERHISLDAGNVVMNPISGTYRYGSEGPSLAAAVDFLTSRKETDELYMVVDEELKMMARICPDGGRVIGPFLKELSSLAHTEYLIEGRSHLDVRDILRESMFAPTVTGSPLENACRVVARYEPAGRGYYAGAVALIGRDEGGQRRMDSAILIRTAEIDAAGETRIGVGATLVRHSDPHSEAAETRAKAATLLRAARSPAAGQPPTPALTSRLGDAPEIRRRLRERNSPLGRFWFQDWDRRRRVQPRFAGLETLVVDAEDTFTAMLAQQLRALGLAVRVMPHVQVATDDLAKADLTVLGPGPGDPADPGDPRIRTLAGLAQWLIDGTRPFLAVCLGHQVVAARLGLTLTRRKVTSQGVQRMIDLFGRAEAAGFYSTFAATSDADLVPTGSRRGMVELSRDPDTHEVYAMRAGGFATLQFHPESILTRNGPDILAACARWALDSAPL